MTAQDRGNRAFDHRDLLDHPFDRDRRRQGDTEVVDVAQTVAGQSGGNLL